jgi:Uma2 family endonuclease
MSSVARSSSAPRPLPDHTQLPDSDGRPVENFLGHPQSILLTDAIFPVLVKKHPDGQFAIGQNSGIYWKLTDPPLDGARAPDWFYIPGVPPMLHGLVRRSYVLWQEHVPPLIIIEFVSGTGREERDRTPQEGKFWVYEQAIKAPYYVIYEFDPGRLEVYHRVNELYQPLKPNQRGHFPIAPLGVELGIWHGTFMGYTVPWLRWYDAQGNLLPLSEERLEQEKQRAEQEKQRAEQMAARLRTLGIDPDNL